MEKKKVKRKVSPRYRSGRALGNYSKGRYKPKNLQKYKGNATTIVYRSSWEHQFCIWCDSSKDILEWSSEEIVIPYYDQVSEKRRRYFVDFMVKFADGNTYLIEIKPKAQTSPPVQGRKTEATFLKEVKTFGVNQSKWSAADEYAKDRGMLFKVFTETELEKLGIQTRRKRK